MKKIILFYFLLISAGVWAQQKSPVNAALVVDISFDADWRFTKDSVANAEEAGFNDANWKKVTLPHDWSIEDLPGQTPGAIVGPFNKSAVSGGATGFMIGGTGWYRKKFITEKATAGKLVGIHFDGVYMNSDVWLNGHLLGNHPYGYTPFYYDLTPYLNPPGKENILAVKVRNEGKTSRWYSGSGIYRHVWLTVTGKVHLAGWGVYITTPEVSADKATVKIACSVNSEQSSAGNISLVTTILSPAGKVVSQTEKAVSIPAVSTITEDQSIGIPNPKLWSVETPTLYKAVTEIKQKGKIIDRQETTFGIRSLSFSAQNGFLLNGKHVLLKGGCIHNDNGLLGSATIDRAEERKVELLKQNGYNAIRTSHNPPSKQFLDACDRLGMLVLDEAFDMWEKGKNPQDYHLYFKEWWKKDLDAMILRDRNHPSVILWSIGNEIVERADSSGLRITGQLAAEVHRLDKTRPVTEAICSFWDHPGYKWDTTAYAYAKLDVGGYNYMNVKYESDHVKFPNRIMVGTESYPRAALENWDAVEKLPYLLGDFVWTAVDYMGEASIGNSSIDKTRKFSLSLGWPWYNAWCGDIDLIGNKKPQSYYRDVVWREKPIAMAVHTPIPEGMIENVSPWGWPDEQQSWNWAGNEGKELNVRVFSRAPMVRLLLNGNIISEQKMAAGSITASFKVPYQPGTLTAVNVVDGKETDRFTLKTAGSPKYIALKADRVNLKNSTSDLAYVMVEVTDEKNQIIPNAEISLQFSVSGAGELLAAGNANPTDMASFKGTERKTFQGRCLAIIRPTGKTGKIVLKAMGKGLSMGQIEMNVN